jgi:ribosomal protein S18 acetylase RimI-like enzyme
MTSRPGYFIKIPFFWKPGCPVPAAERRLQFRAADRTWLEDALGEVMDSSPDPSDAHAVQQMGPRGAALDLLGAVHPYFEVAVGWWQCAEDERGERVGFVLPVVFADQARTRDGLREGTIFHMGVLPSQRGKGYGHALLAQATRTLCAAGVWRIFCDTAANNAPMIAAFRAAQYLEREPWERPISWPPPEAT